MTPQSLIRSEFRHHRDGHSVHYLADLTSHQENRRIRVLNTARSFGYSEVQPLRRKHATAKLDLVRHVITHHADRNLTNSRL